jgi:hypothetical protein
MGHPAFTKIHHPKKRAYLAAYAATGRHDEALRIAEVDRSLHYIWKSQDPDYAEAFALAKEMSADLHEDEATRRAMGWDETRVAENGTSYTIRKQSDTLLIVRLKALRPDVYRENATIKHEGEITLALENRLREANARIVRLRNGEQDRLIAG